MGEVESVGTVELVCVGRLLRMGCDSFLIPVCGSVGGGEPLWEQSGLPWEHSVENQWRGGGRGRKPYSVGVGRGEAETESLILWLVVLDLLAGGWGWHEAQSLIQGWLETHILYTWL